MKVTMNQLRKAVKEVNAVIVDESAGRWRVLQIEAPEGFEWNSGGCLNLKVEWPAGTSSSEVFADAIERIKCGLTPLGLP
jgi:hypothetical protein